MVPMRAVRLPWELRDSHRVRQGEGEQKPHRGHHGNAETARRELEANGGQPISDLDRALAIEALAEAGAVGSGRSNGKGRRDGGGGYGVVVTEGDREWAAGVLSRVRETGRED
jgi:hypothetical protein